MAFGIGQPVPVSEFHKSAEFALDLGIKAQLGQLPSLNLLFTFLNLGCTAGKGSC